MPASEEFVNALRKAADGRVIASIVPREPPEQFEGADAWGVRLWFEHAEGRPDWVDLYARSVLMSDSRDAPVLVAAWPREVATSVSEREGT